MTPVGHFAWIGFLQPGPFPEVRKSGGWDSTAKHSKRQAASIEWWRMGENGKEEWRKVGCSGATVGDDATLVLSGKKI